jgi:hypothetical protein
VSEQEEPLWAEPFGAPPSAADLPYVRPPGPPRKPARRVGLAIAVVITVLAAGFGLSSLAQGDGASDPEGAVRDLFGAISDEDAIGVVQAITPSERSVLRPAVEDVAGEARRLDVASKDLDLTDISGIELDVQDLELSSHELGDGVAMVEVTGGTMSSSVAIDKLPLGPVVREVIDRQDAEIDDTETTAPLQGVKLVALRRDGGWRVSLLYSIAEAMRRDADPEPALPTFGAGIPERGAASPEAAVRDAVAAATALDVRRLIELTSGDEMAVLHDYGPLIVDATKDAKADDHDGVSVDDLKLAVHDGTDGRKVVEATAYKVSIGDDDDGVDISFDGKCTEVTTHFSYDDTFVEIGEPIGTEDGTVDGSFDPGVIDDGPTHDEGPQSSTITSCIGDSKSMSPMDLFGTMGTGVATPRIVVEQRDGLWYIVPARTLFDTLSAGLKRIDRDQVRSITRMWTGDAEWLWYPKEFWDDCGVDQPSATATEREGNAALEECLRSN